MADYTKAVYDLLHEHGCVFVRRGKGDHNIYYSPIKGENLSVDGKIKFKQAANATLQKAGIKKRI